MQDRESSACFLLVFFPRTPHPFLKYFRIISRTGKPGSFRCFNHRILHQKSGAALYPVIQQIIKQRLLHIFFKQPAALRLTDIHLSCYILQCDFFRIMLMKIAENLFQTLNISGLCSVLCMNLLFSPAILPDCQPVFHKKQINLKFQSITTVVSLFITKDGSLTARMVNISIRKN